MNRGLQQGPNTGYTQEQGVQNWKSQKTSWGARSVLGGKIILSFGRWNQDELVLEWWEKEIETVTAVNADRNSLKCVAMMSSQIQTNTAKLIE